jgi:SH3-like domain-containing protein
LVLLLFFLCFPAVAPGAERFAVSSPIANIRSGPGTDFDIIWKVERYYPVIVLEKKDNWCKIEDFEGDKGWIHDSLLDKTQTIVVKNHNCNVRSGPGTDFPVVFRAKQGVPFKCLKTQGAWINIQHADGDTGWIYQTLTW